MPYRATDCVGVAIDAVTATGAVLRAMALTLFRRGWHAVQISHGPCLGILPFFNISCCDLVFFISMLTARQSWQHKR